MKLWFDDVRPAPPGWTWAKTVLEAIQHLETGEVQRASLDHDIGFFLDAKGDRVYFQEADFIVKNRGEPERLVNVRAEIGQAMQDGTDLVRWMAEHDTWPAEKPVVHSMNPVGKKRMQEMIERYWHPKE